MVNVKDIYNCLNAAMPFETQEGWDNSGVLVDAGRETEKVLCCLDVTAGAVDAAVKEGCRIIVSHHPVIFSGIKKLDCSSVLFKLIKNDISVISAHTNFDKYHFGTSWRLAEFCGLKGESTLQDFAVTVNFETTKDFDCFVKEIKENVKIPFTYTKGCKDVSKVFVVAGSGKDMTKEILAAGCDCIVTGESSYHDMLDLSQLGVSCICIGHDESEKISVETLAEVINTAFPQTETVVYTEKGILNFI